MPKIAEIEPTPNPNAMKFILKEPLTWGITRSYDNAGQAQEDPLAAALFDIEHVLVLLYEPPTQARSSKTRMTRCRLSQSAAASG